MLQSENIMLGLLEVSWGWVGPQYKAKYFLSRAGERHCMYDGCRLYHEPLVHDHLQFQVPSM